MGVLLIGTNNLGHGHLPGETAHGVVAVIETLLNETRGKLLVVALLPRGDVKKLRQLCPPRCTNSGRPFKSFMPAIAKVNNIVAESLSGLRGHERAAFVDCGAPFLSVDDNQ